VTRRTASQVTRDGYQRCDILFSASERYEFRICARSAQCSLLLIPSASF
jgi:hypothetical protein